MIFKTDYCLIQVKEHSAILSTFVKLPFVIKIFVLSVFEWSLKTGFTVICYLQHPDELDLPPLGSEEIDQHVEAVDDRPMTEKERKMKLKQDKERQKREREDAKRRKKEEEKERKRLEKEKKALIEQEKKAAKQKSKLKVKAIL